MNKKIIQPADELIERTALTFACIYYEAGRSTGLKSKFKNAKSFARNNFEKFIPRVVEHFLDILANPTFDKDAKIMIWEALQKRHNDPNLKTEAQLPNVDVKKLIEMTKNGKVNSSEANLKIIDDLIKTKPTTDPFLNKFRMN